MSEDVYCLGFLQTQGGGGFFEASQFKMQDQRLAKLRKYSLWNWYSPPLATVTTDHKFSGLRQQKFLILFWSCHVACGILVPQPGMKFMPPAVEAQSLNHWTVTEVQRQQKCLTVLEFRSPKSIPLGQQSEVDSAGSVGRLQEEFAPGLLQIQIVVNVPGLLAHSSNLLHHHI